MLVTVGSSNITIGGLGCPEASIMRHWLAKDIHSHKANLEQQAAREIGQLRSALERHAHEHAVTFTRLHGQRVIVIGEVYGRLRRVHDAMGAWMAFMGPPKPELADGCGHYRGGAGDAE